MPLWKNGSAFVCRRIYGSFIYGRMAGFFRPERQSTQNEAGDFYYIRVDEAGYGKIYYIFSEVLDDFLDEWLIANSFTEFLEMIQFPEEKRG